MESLLILKLYNFNIIFAYFHQFYAIQKRKLLFFAIVMIFSEKKISETDKQIREKSKKTLDLLKDKIKKK